MITNIKEVNQNILERGVNKLPLDIMDIQGFVKKQKDNEIILSNENGQLTLNFIKGTNLHKYVVRDEIKEAIINLFDKISETEDKFHQNPIKLEQEVEQYSEKLPDLYKKLEETHWIVTQASGTEVINEFLNNVENELNKLKKNKPR